MTTLTARQCAAELRDWVQQMPGGGSQFLDQLLEHAERSSAPSKSFNPGEVVDVSYVDEQTGERVTAYRGVVQGPADRHGDYVIRVSELLNTEGMQVAVGDLRQPILGSGVELARFERSTTPAEARTGISDRAAAALADVAELRREVAVLMPVYGIAQYVAALDRIEAALRERA